MHSLTNVYERLKTLTGQTGFTPAKGTIINAELKGYTVGFCKLTEYFDQILKEVFVSTASIYGLSKLLEMTRIDECENIEDAREALVRRLARQFGDFAISSLNNEIEQISDKIIGVAIGRVYYLFCINWDWALLKKLGKLILNEFPIYMEVALDGYGMKWEKFDSCNLTFNQFDDIDCPFSVLDTIRS